MEILGDLLDGVKGLTCRYHTDINGPILHETILLGQLLTVVLPSSKLPTRLFPHPSSFDTR